MAIGQEAIVCRRCWRGECPESEDHEAGPSRHERNGGGATCNQWGAEGGLGGSSEGSSGDWAFMKRQGIGFGALWRTELQAPGRQNEALKGLPGMPSEWTTSGESTGWLVVGRQKFWDFSKLSSHQNWRMGLLFLKMWTLGGAAAS